MMGLGTSYYNYLENFSLWCNLFCSLFLFAKFLKLLVYLSMICTSNSFICNHTTPPCMISQDLPTVRLNVIGHFSPMSFDISFTLSKIEDIFESKVPRLQIMWGTEKLNVPPSFLEHQEDGTGDEASQKKDLHRGIQKWWEGLDQST